MATAESLPRLLLVGGSGGLVGRSLLPELTGRYRIRSVHRHPTPAEESAGVEWIAADVGSVDDWTPIVRDVDVIVNLAWYRWGTRAEFEKLYTGLSRLLHAARGAAVRRVLHLSVPAAPPSIEQELPYLVFKRRFDAELADSGLSHRILRPTMMFGPGDVLLTVMLKTIHRYRRFPMFGDGEYHASPIAVADVARLLRLEAERKESGTVDLGGPRRFRYRELTGLLFASLGIPPRYVRLSTRRSLWLATTLQALGSSLLYAYEVEWLVSDRLGLAPAQGLDRPLTPLEPFLLEEAQRLRARA